MYFYYILNVKSLLSIKQTYCFERDNYFSEFLSKEQINRLFVMRHSFKMSHNFLVNNILR